MRPTIALACLGVLACAALAVVTWALAFRTGLGHSVDVQVLEALRTFSDTRAETPARLVVLMGDPLPFALVTAALVAIGYVRRGAWTAAVVAGVLVVPSVLTQILKRTLAEDRLAPVSVEAAAYPSGHTTAACVIAIAAVLIVRGSWRPVVALAGLMFALAMAGSVVVLGWHFPSDTVGAFAVAGAGGCVGAALLSRPVATAARPARWRLARG